jgi:hypothetical protein
VYLKQDVSLYAEMKKQIKYKKKFYCVLQSDEITRMLRISSFILDMAFCCEAGFAGSALSNTFISLFDVFHKFLTKKWSIMKSKS